MVFNIAGYIHLVPDIASVNKAFECSLNELDICINYGKQKERSSNWKLPLAQRIYDLGVIIN